MRAKGVVGVFCNKKVQSYTRAEASVDNKDAIFTDSWYEMTIQLQSNLICCRVDIIKYLLVSTN